jgi:glycosyltransferase involved in cell wall biosynthesis
VIVCHIGAREHYAVAKTLHRAGLLAELITDLWVSPESGWSHLPGRAGAQLRGRFDQDLRTARITHFTRAALAHEMRGRAAGRSQWQSIIERNRWFQVQAVRHLQATLARRREAVPPVVLAYSYAARDILRLARDRGATTILAQIDGGKADEDLIASLWAQQALIVSQRAPATYWEDWLDECRLADRIIVNSPWSSDLLVRAGIDQVKLVEAPVIYERNGTMNASARLYPAEFAASRPLRVLYLGTLSRRKGAVEALDAARHLAGRPVQFVFVGGDPEDLAAAGGDLPNAHYHGRVPRSRVGEFLDDADVFLFPTHSDGFGMTQIEALASGLPVIASRNCAPVIEHGRTGLLLDEVSPRAIAQAIETCLAEPASLAAMSAAALSAAERFERRSVASLLEAVRGVITLSAA